jgi:hypothetical protein
MFGAIPLDVVIPFGFFGLFLFYHSKYHSSRSIPPYRVVEELIGASVIACVLTNILFLVYFGIHVTWWASLVLLALFIPFFIIGVFAERIIGRLGLVFYRVYSLADLCLLHVYERTVRDVTLWPQFS